MGRDPKQPSETITGPAPAEARQMEALVPLLLLEHPRRTGPHSYDGAVLFADISGFTSLTEALSSRGPEGSEVLNRLLNAYFTPLISTVSAHGGYLLNLAGDSLTALFHDEDPEGDIAFVRAAYCAHALQALTLGFQQVQTPIGEVCFSIKATVGSGQLNTAVVGSPIVGRSFITYGDALDNTAALEKCSHPGQTLVDDHVLRALLGAVSERVQHPDIKAPRGCNRIIALPELQLRSPKPGPHLAEERDVRPHIHPAVWNYLSRGAGAFLNSIRQVTALFIGFDEQADPEERHRALSSYFAKAQEIIDRYRGFLLGFEAGDKGSKLLALFGAPVGVEHASARALEAALDLQQACVDEPLIGNQRIGVATGSLYVGLAGGAGQYRYTALGDSMNLAARLMTKTAHGTVLVDRATRERAGEGYRWGDEATITVKGKQVPIKVHPLHAREGREGVVPLRRGRGLVGRNAELRRIREHTEATLTGHGQVLAFVGEAGIGKSRLLEPLIAQATEILSVPVLIGSCAEYTQGLAYRPWWPALSHMFSLSQRDPDTEAKITEVVGRLCPEHLERIGLLGTMVGVNLETPEFFRQLPPAEQQRLAEETVVDVLCAAHRKDGLMLIFDDAHWMDSSSASLLSRVARRIRNHPILLAVALRPPSEDRDKDQEQRQLLETLQTVPHLGLFQLASLRPKDVSRYACRRLDARSLGPDVLQILVERSQCNPLILEELCDLLSQSGQLIVHRGCARLTLKPDQLTVPESVTGLVLARLEHASADARICLQVASVLGRHFTLAQLVTLHPGPTTAEVIRAALSEAHRLDILRVERDSGGDAYFFKHVLSQEAIYNSLTFEVRRGLHRTIAMHFEGRCTHENRRDMVPLIAEHYRRIGDAEKLKEYATEAGQLALERHLNRVAATWFLLDAELRHKDESPAAEGAALAAAQEALVNLGDLEEQTQVLGRWEEVAERTNDKHMLAQMLAARVSHLHRRGFSEEALHKGQSAQLLLSEIGDTRAQIELKLALSSIYLETKQLDAAHTSLNEVQGLLSDKKYSRLLARFHGQEGLYYLMRSKPEQALQCLNQALSLSWECGDPVGENHTMGTIGILHYRMESYEQAINFLEQAAELSKRLGNLRQEGRHRFNMACAAIKVARLSDAQEQLQRANTLFERTDYSLGQSSALICLLSTGWLIGDPSSVEEVVDRLDLMSAQLPPPLLPEYHWHLGELAYASGDLAASVTWAQKAIDGLNSAGPNAASLEALVLLAEVEWKRGDLSAAVEHVHRACAMLEQDPIKPEWPERLHWRLRELFSAMNQPTRAQSALMTATALAQEFLAHHSQATQAVILSVLPWFRRILAAGVGGGSTTPPTAPPPLQDAA